MPHKHPKLRLSPLQNDILWFLEEPGEAYISVILEVLHVKYKHLQGSAFLRLMVEAVRILLKLEFIEVCRREGRDPTPIFSPELDHVLSFDEVFYWDDGEHAWKWEEKKGGANNVSLALTDKGAQALTAS